MRKRLAVLISNAGTGSNLRAIIDAIKNKKLNAEIALVVSEQDDAIGLKRAEKNNIPTLTLNEIVKKKKDKKRLGHKNVLGTAREKLDLIRIFKKNHIDFVCLAGWKQIIPDEMINQFKIINIHPGLIPDSLNGVIKNPDGTDSLWNRGKFTTVAIQNFLDQKATYAGSSVHFLSKEFDFGEVLERVFVKIEPNDSVLSLYHRLKKEENRIYVEALKRICN